MNDDVQVAILIVLAGVCVMAPVIYLAGRWLLGEGRRLRGLEAMVRRPNVTEDRP